ncbi:MAG: acetyl-CoA carboxylase biotin carboxyl carrier protein subunit [Eubacteriaceae bacterium]|nr:acetyl-CoA carboxylase biotin carboxyl carrier protein subunit [Eubacteriaceae bacterium]
MEKYIVRVNGKSYEVEVERVDGDFSSAPAAPAAAPVAAPAPAAKAEGIDVASGTAGKVWKIVTKVGDEVKKGDSILILEAMKMEIPVVATEDGKIADICVNEGDPVEAGQVVAVLA